VVAVAVVVWCAAGGTGWGECKFGVCVWELGIITTRMVGYLRGELRRVTITKNGRRGVLGGAGCESTV
jgi:hypothetical protein